jgi:hypothetical protein
MNGFIDVKLQEDLWPELMVLHLHIFNLEVNCIPRTAAAVACPANEISQPQKLVATLYHKTLVSTLRVWLSLCGASDSIDAADGPGICSPAKVRGGFGPIRECVGSFGMELGWLLLPLLGSQQLKSSHRLVVAVYHVLLQLPQCSSSVEYLLQTVGGFMHEVAHKQHHQQHHHPGNWGAIISKPKLVSVSQSPLYWSSYRQYSGREGASVSTTSRARKTPVLTTSDGGVAVSQSDSILQKYCDDKQMLLRILELLQQFEGMECSDGNSSHLDNRWKTVLQRWKSV